VKYKDFVAWCNQRACDGCWSRGTALYCIGIMRKIDGFPFWKREKEWRKIKDEVEKNVVSVIEAKIKQVYGRVIK
jgi:hypothetical protein